MVERRAPSFDEIAVRLLAITIQKLNLGDVVITPEETRNFDEHLWSTRRLSIVVGEDGTSCKLSLMPSNDSSGVQFDTMNLKCLAILIARYGTVEIGESDIERDFNERLEVLIEGRGEYGCNVLLRPEAQARDIMARQERGLVINPHGRIQ